MIHTTIKIVIVFGVVFLPITSFASMSSETFTIEADNINLADTNLMNSSNFTIDGQLGEAILGGDLTSSNFEANTGFQSVISSALSTPPTPIPAASGGGGGTDAPVLDDLTGFSVPLTLSPEQSGILTQRLSGGGELTLPIPRYSTSFRTTFEVRERRLPGGSVPSRASGATLVGDTIFDITFVDDNGNSVNTLLKDLTVTLNIPYLPDDTSALGAYYLNKAVNEWVLVPGALFSNGVLVFKTKSPLLFAIYDVAGLPGVLKVASEGIDTNADGRVDIFDFNTLMIQWGESGPATITDFNNDGVVDIFDFNLLMVNWTG